MATRLARHHAQNTRVRKPQRGLNLCARCSGLVPHDSDHLRAQLHGVAIVLHLRCFLALMRGGGETPAQYNDERQKPRMRDGSAANDEMLSVREVTG